MRIAVIGTGNIGRTLGTALAAAGHDVALGSRHPGDGGAADGPPTVETSSALDGADVVLLALPARAVPEFLGAHAERHANRLVIDATNNVGAPVANAAAVIAEAVPTARYVRAFNTLGWENFANPVFDGVAADLFFSAPANDREVVEGLIADVGLRPVYLGADRQDLVDTLLPLWFTLSQLRGERRLAFRLLHD